MPARERENPIPRLPARYMGQCASAGNPNTFYLAAPPMTSSSAVTAAIHSDPRRDITADLPDECLELIFHSLGSGDRNRCSLVCRRWLLVDGRSRHRLSLDARSGLIAAAPSIFARFESVCKLALKCDRRSESIGDEALLFISLRCPNLTRLKIRSCRALTDAGMAALSRHCPRLRKLSCGSCAFGSKGIDALLRGCPALEKISIKRLRGLSDAAGEFVGSDAAAAVASSLQTVCLKELYSGQCFAPLITGCPNLRTLKLFRCSGDWDFLLEEIAVKVPGIVEIHIEKLQVSDRGLHAISAFSNLEVLHLVKTPECTDAGLVAIADKCPMLRKIHIDGRKTNRIGDEGLMAVARRCTNLRELILIGINPTSLSLEQIAINCRNLERLALCSSETFGDAEISCIAARCFALKKLCIKGCPVSDQGMEALAEGCPNLVKVKVKKCRGVTPEFAEWLKASRGSLAVNLDTAAAAAATDQLDGEISDSGILSNSAADLAPGLADPPLAIGLPASSSNGRSPLWKARRFMSLALRKWSSQAGGSSQQA